MACPRCDHEMRHEGDWMVCPCGYRHELPKKMPSYPELLDENNRLKAKVKELKLIIDNHKQDM